MVFLHLNVFHHGVDDWRFDRESDKESDECFDKKFINIAGNISGVGFSLRISILSLHYLILIVSVEEVDSIGGTASSVRSIIEL